MANDCCGNKPKEKKKGMKKSRFWQEVPTKLNSNISLFKNGVE